MYATHIAEPESGSASRGIPKTVNTYRASLMRKLNIHDLVGLVKFAIEKLTSTSAQR